ncbi:MULTISPECIES: hypothetical protein [Streptomyces rochei group]|uniref:hypothetical protein n=1 Tax=Streptomyces rochei group TaxID=2867164 RepID=UPI00187518EA|nr:hypothetical protein [Streptomyces vinaceusdrappus]GHC37269.1 hypothetical protein GCM10010308_64810 [Streptomyces vinaceusdrappus]
MARSNFSFDEGAFRKAARDGVAKMARTLTTALNGLKTQYQGKPIEDVKAAVQSTWSKHTGGGSITDPELTQFAEQIQQGGRVEVRLS